ncbi:MAG: ATP-binding protein [Candidatus Thermoplasmatota archaeon]|nr:ATP-binding protein [Candidatus Thermoplasmatota archaeon]
MEPIENIMALGRSLVGAYTEDGRGLLPIRRIAGSVIDDCLLRSNDMSKRPRVLILSGLRGVGKTTILFQAIRDLTKAGIPQDDIIFVSMDRAAFSGSSIRDIVVNYERMRGRHLIDIGRPVFFFIDEAHYSDKWALQLKTLTDEAPNAVFVATGSSALELEISPDLARRSLSLHIHPLNFLEFLQIRSRGDRIDPLDHDAMNALFDRKDADSAFLAFEGSMERARPAMRKLGGYSPGSLEAYILKGGLPFSISMEDPYPLLYDTVRRIMEKDVPIAGDHDPGTLRELPRILGSIAPSPDISMNSIARDLEGMSVKTVRGVLDTLSRTGLIFEVGVMGGVKNTLRSDTRKYFATPSLGSCILRTMGRDPRDHMGNLAETSVVSLIHHRISGFFSLRYRKDRGSCDLIVCGPSGNVAVEVGFGKKQNGSTQLRRTMRESRCNYGILISDRDRPELSGNIIMVPIKEFLSL